MTALWPRGAYWLTAIAAVLAFASSVRFTTYVPWGTDSAGYVEQAERLAHGVLVEPLPLALGPAWAWDTWLVTPLAARSGPVSGTEVGIYPLGYPLLMAAIWPLAGELGAYLVVPLCLALLVWSMARVAAAMGGWWAGALTAVFIVMNPVARVNSVVPMSDVPAASLWALAWAAILGPGLGASAAAGAATTLAILIRPNLAPFGAVLAWMAPGVPTRAQRTTRLLVYGAAAAIGPLVQMWSQASLYGSPVRSGYPGVEAFYRVAFIAENLQIYPEHLLFVHTPVIVLGLLTPFLLRGGEWTTLAMSRRVAWSAVAVAALNLAFYLPYLPQDDPHSLRFLLPGVMALLALLAAGTVRAAAWLAERRWWLAPLALLPALYLHGPAMEYFAYPNGFASTQQRVLRVGRYMQAALPKNAVVFCYLQSAAVSHYTGAPVVRFDFIAPEQLDMLARDLTQRGYRPMLLLDEAMEMPAFRVRFASAPLASLDWPPRARAFDAATAMALYDLTDRDVYTAGQRWPTDVIRP